MIFRRTFLRRFFVSKNSFEVRSPKLFNVTRGWSPPSWGNSSNQKPIAFNRTVRNRRVSLVDGKVLHQTETNERSLKLPCRDSTFSNLIRFEILPSRREERLRFDNLSPNRCRRKLRGQESFYFEAKQWNLIFDTSSTFHRTR